MLGFYYGLILLIWIILVLILKWRKNRAKLEQQILQQNARPQIHVIQIGSSLYDVIPISPNHREYRCDCTEYNLNMDCDRHQHHHTNVGFILDDTTPSAGLFPDHHNLSSHSAMATSVQNDRVIQSTPPPSYDDVMRNVTARNIPSTINNNFEQSTTNSDENLPKYINSFTNSGSDINNRNRYNISHSIDHNSI